MLKDISVWSDDLGWVPTTPEKAQQMYPYGLSSYSRKFLCERCGQYAEFYYYIKTPTFRHRGNSRDCEDKITSNNNYRLTNPLGFSLPLKLMLYEDSFNVYIGFLPLSEAQFKNAEKNGDGVTISIRSNEMIRRYIINGERFSSEHITYLSVGNVVAEQYILSSSIDKKTWPSIVNGFSPSGTLFDVETGKRLPQNADVEVGRNYSLVIKDYFIMPNKDIECIKKRVINGWALYHVKATELTKNAADFFQPFGARLTSSPSQIIPLWPPCFCTSHILLHLAPHIWFHITGGGCAEVYPYQHQLIQNTVLYKLITSTSFNQILSVSRFENRTTVLRYAMLRRATNFSRPKRELTVNIKDINGDVIDLSVHTILPKHKSLSINAPFDGFVEIVKGNTVISRMVIRGGEERWMDVDFNLTVCVYQGLDKAAELSFKHKHTGAAGDDVGLLKMLSSFNGCEIKIAHTISVIAVRMEEMPKTRQWLLERVRRGTIDERAIALLRKIGRGQAK